MYEDDPQDSVFDVLGEAVFGDHPLGPGDHRHARGGGRHAGRRAAAFHGGRYTAQNVVVAAAGSVDHDRIVELVAAAIGRSRRASARRPRRWRCRARSARRARSSPRTPSSTTSALGAPGVARDDERRFALRVLDSDARRDVVVAPVPGGARAARAGLLGLLVHRPFAGTGQIGLYLGTRPDNVADGDEGRRRRADAAARRLTAEELDRSKENVKGRIVLALESTTARMNRLGSLGAGRHAGADRRRGRSSASTRSRSRTSRAGRASCRARAAQRRRHRRRRGRLPRRAREAVSPALAAAAERRDRASPWPARPAGWGGVCAAVRGAEDLVLAGRADPALGTPLAAILPATATCSSTSRGPTRRWRTRSPASRPACTS